MGRMAPYTSEQDASPPPRAARPAFGECPTDERRHCLGTMWTAATVAERERLARELHDLPAQLLASLQLRLYAIQERPELAGLPGVRDELADLASGCAEALRELREEIHGLRECSADGRPLADLIEGLLGRFSRSTGLDASLAVPASEPFVLPPDAVTHVGRIVAEALTNVRKHAEASRVRVRLDADGAGLALSITDDGRGFETDAGARDGYGLLVMRERAELIGGTLRVDSRPGEGTRVLVRVPATGGDGRAAR